MARLTCMNIVWAGVLALAAAVVYTYFIKFQPHAALLSAIKSKDYDAFTSALSSALSSLPTYHPPDSVHFGEGRSLAHAVAMHGTERMLSHLHALHFALDSASSSDLRTPLHVAAVYNTPSFLRLLLSLTPSAPIDPVAGNGFTPLLWATLFSQHENARVLLEHGANANARAGSGLSALQMAVVYSNDAMVVLLLDHGATLAPTESYYADVQSVRKRLAAHRAKERAAEERTQDGEDEEGKDGDVDALGSAGEGGEDDGLDEGQRMKAKHWEEKKRMLAGGPPFEPWEWK